MSRGPRVASAAASLAPALLRRSPASSDFRAALHSAPVAPLSLHNSVAVVQGSDRGIGLQFVEQLLRRFPSAKVVATCRDPAGAEHLDALHDQSGGRLDVLRIDVLEEDSIQTAADTVRSKYGYANLLINCSGIFHVPNLLQPEASMRWVDKDAATLVFQVNALGPMLVTKHFVPLLEAAVKDPQDPLQLSVLANLSSRTGSIAENRLGGWFSYRASKAALNQFTRTTAAELSQRQLPVVAVALHPGTVDTDLTRPFQKHLTADRIFTPEFAVSKLLDQIEGLKEKDNGRFIAWDGADVPW